MNDIHRHTPEARAGQKCSSPISESRLITLGGIMGLVAMPGRHSGQCLADAAQELKTEPDFVADAEFIERELFIPDNHKA
jgi:hypothetical protein